MSTLTTLDILRGAKTVIERNGWTWGDYYTQDGARPPAECPVCLVGALTVALGHDPDDVSGLAKELLVEPVEQLEKVLRARMGAEDVDIVEWNDTEGRTVDDVYGLLGDAIAQVESMAGGAR